MNERVMDIQAVAGQRRDGALTPAAFRRGRLASNTPRMKDGDAALDRALRGGASANTHGRRCGSAWPGLTRPRTGGTRGSRPCNGPVVGPTGVGAVSHAVIRLGPHRGAPNRPAPDH